MKVIRNINNNVAVCEDSNGNEVVAFGKGIGFRTPPYEVDIKDIDRTFYSVDKRYIELIKDVDDRIVEVAMDIRNYATAKDLTTSSNFLFSLIDHINFAIERQEKGIQFTLPIKDDIRYKFAEEMEVGKYALKVIHEKLGVLMPQDEACYIALNIVNSETEVSNRQEKEQRTISEITDIITSEMNTDINKEGVNYSRFCSHMYYILRKTEFNQEDNYRDLLNTLKQANRNEYECALKIRDYLKEHGYGNLSEDEVLFMTLHVSRLCQRENE